MKKISRIILPLIIAAITSNAQYNEYEPDYEWLTIETENISVHYHPEAERTARVVTQIMEDVWDPICKLYRYEPDRVHFVIKDIDDYANGATYFLITKLKFGLPH